MAWIARHNHRLYRAYLLKEQLRVVFPNGLTERRTDNLIALCLLDRGGHCPLLPDCRAEPSSAAVTCGRRRLGNTIPPPRSGGGDDGG